MEHTPVWGEEAEAEPPTVQFPQGCFPVGVPRPCFLRAPIGQVFLGPSTGAENALDPWSWLWTFSSSISQHFRLLGLSLPAALLDDTLLI